MKTYYQLFSFLFFALLLAGCENQPAPQVRIPRTEIVYQTTNPDKTEVGFVNADGSSASFVSLDNYVIRPMWSASGNKIIGMARDGQAVLGGTPAYWDLDRNSKLCNNWYASGAFDK